MEGSQVCGAAVLGTNDFGKRNSGISRSVHISGHSRRKDEP